MSTTLFPRLPCLGLVLCAVLAACGGAGDAHVNTAPAAHAAQLPVADCEPQGCRGLRIVDSNAETFRADRARRDALGRAVAAMDDPSASR